VFQSYALFPNLTVAANVGYGLVNRRARQAEMTRASPNCSRSRHAEPGRQIPGAALPAGSSSAARSRARLHLAGLLLLDEPLSRSDAGCGSARDEIKLLQRGSA